MTGSAVSHSGARRWCGAPARSSPFAARISRTCCSGKGIAVWGSKGRGAMDVVVRSSATYLLAVLSAASVAQTAPTVRDADIERAKKLQPNITDADIERAQRRYQMPTDEELSRVPLPSAPKLEALPVPRVGGAIDLEAISKGYDQSVGGSASVGVGPELLVFVSFAMPEATLVRLVEQASRSRATLVLRGLVGGSLKETIGRVQQLIGGRDVAFEIDPQAFDRFGVKKTPTFVLVGAEAKRTPCGAGVCFASDAFASTSGDVSIDYALEYIARSAPRFAKDAGVYLKRIRG